MSPPVHVHVLYILFIIVGGEGGSGGMLNWENLSLKYSQIPEGGFKTGFKINKQCIDTNVQCLKREVFTT